MTCFIKRLSDTAVIPNRATTGSVGYDLYSDEKLITINPGETVMVRTGIAIENNDPRTAIMIYPRSGLSCKHSITLANCVGIVDSDFRGEILVALVNHGNTSYTVCQGDRIAQLVFQPIKLPVLKEVDNIRDTDRSSNGFGSTGV